MDEEKSKFKLVPLGEEVETLSKKYKIKLNLNGHKKRKNHYRIQLRKMGRFPRK